MGSSIAGQHIKTPSNKLKLQNKSILLSTRSSVKNSPLSQKYPNVFFVGACICSIWSVSAIFVNYLFASIDLIKLCGFKQPTMQGYHLIFNGPWYHLFFIGLIYFSLFASLLTIILVSGVSIYNRVLNFNFHSLKEYFKKEMTWGGGIGFLASLICTITYMLWSLFSASSLFYSNITAYFFMAGTGLSMLLFITPSVVKVLNNLCARHKKKQVLGKKLLIFAGVGEISIFPILFCSCKEDLQKHMHFDSKVSTYVSFSIVIISAILMIIATQEETTQEPSENKKTTGLCGHQLFGMLLLACTGITGGTFSTYIGLCKLGWLPNTAFGFFLKLLWSGVAAIYWIAFYRGVLKKVCDNNNHCRFFGSFSFFQKSMPHDKEGKTTTTEKTLDGITTAIVPKSLQTINP